MATIQDFYHFTVDEIPVERILSLRVMSISFSCKYNTHYDFYTMTIKDLDNNILITNKLTYLSAINDSVIEGLNIVSKKLFLSITMILTMTYR